MAPSARHASSSLEGIRRRVRVERAEQLESDLRVVVADPAGRFDVFADPLIADQAPDHEKRDRRGRERRGREALEIDAGAVDPHDLPPMSYEPQRAEETLVVGVLEEDDVGLAERDRDTADATVKARARRRSPDPPPSADPTPVIIAARSGTPARRAAIDP